MKVMYRLDGDHVDGLEKLLWERNRVMNDAAKASRHSRPVDAARDAWTDAVTFFWIQHDQLGGFDRRELRFDLGQMDKITIVIDNLSFNIKAGAVEIDWRLEGWENEVYVAHDHNPNTQLVAKIEFDEIEFERRPDEPDARGRYSHVFTEVYDEHAYKIEVYGVVVLKEGKYHLAVQANTVYGCEATLDAMSTFALAVINGEIAPKTRVLEAPAE